MVEIKRKLASIQKIISITDVNGADFIQESTVLGWTLCVKKDEFKVGDLCVFFEIDSILPEHPIFEFMEPRKYRVKTAKFRKRIISQGLALPIRIMEAFMSPHDIPNLKEGDDVTEVIGVTKYEPPEPGTNRESTKVPINPVAKWFLQFAWFRLIYFFIIPRKTKGNFPEFVPKTDEVRIQSMPSILWKNIGKEFYITEKLDGTSATFFYYDKLTKRNMFGLHIDKGKGFGVCSRNLRLPTPDGSYWWDIVEKFNIKETLTKYCKKNNVSLAIQGEIIGSAIQKNKYKLKQGQRIFRVYNIWDITNQCYLQFVEREALCNALDMTMVPHLGTFIIEESTTIKDIIELSTRFSTYNNQTVAEGIVCRNIDDDKISFKAINPKFLLKNDE